jgi:hypothetical protein
MPLSNTFALSASVTNALRFGAVAFTFALGAAACSSAETNDADNASQTEEELRITRACAGKTCGESCTLCPPGARNCFETAVVKQCNAKGRCEPTPPRCEDPPPPPYDPCEGKACGEGCTLCPPGATDCFETAVVKQCNAKGRCEPTPPRCEDPQPPPPPPPYNPCEGKACGAGCTLCPPGARDCFETAVPKQCDANGQCSPERPVCERPDPKPYNPCAGKRTGEQCFLCPPGAADCFETTVVKTCNARGECTPAVGRL